MGYLWYKADILTALANVRFWWISGHHADMRHDNQLMQVKKIDTVKVGADAQLNAIWLRKLRHHGSKNNRALGRGR
jgi:hypothetical protein